MIIAFHNAFACEALRRHGETQGPLPLSSNKHNPITSLTDALTAALSRLDLSPPNCLGRIHDWEERDLGVQVL